MMHDNGRLVSRSALITGGASGIGKATAELFLQEGAMVMIADSNEMALTMAIADLSGISQDVHACCGDVRSMADADLMVSETISRFGKLDILFCNAGIPSVMPLAELAEAEWDAVIDTNAKGIFTLVKSAVPHMRSQGGGTIITAGSEMGIVAVPDSPAYAASKGAVIMFTRAIALDLIRHNIRVNALCPGITRTPLLQAEVDRSRDPERTAREQAQWAPIMRMADPHEIARGALFLATDDSSFAVGSCLVLDGGRTIQ